MKILKSTTDFALEQKRPIAGADLHEADYYHQEYEVLEKIIEHAKFLKQELEKWMFVPCDENGDVLENPHKFIYTPIEMQNYEKAKQKVLFKGFKIVEISRKLKVIINPKNDCQVFSSFNGEPFRKCTQFGIIEDLIKSELELT